jgi:hypothetical protein
MPLPPFYLAEKGYQPEIPVSIDDFGQEKCYIYQGNEFL